MIDRERIEAMRAFADEVRADLEQRQLEEPFAEISNGNSVSDSRETAPPAIVFKTNANALISEQPPFSDFQMDVLASAIAQLRQDLDVTALLDRVTRLEAQMQTLLTLLGADASQRSIEAGEIVRKLRVQR